MPKIGEAEMGALHIRVIALENPVIALLAGASDCQLDLARDMAGYIAKREGITHHPLTTHAAAHLVDLRTVCTIQQRRAATSRRYRMMVGGQAERAWSSCLRLFLLRVRRD